jgi:F-box and WD-40 domain protein 1/11
MPDARTSPTLRLQTTVADFPAPSLSPTFKLDEGYSDETRSQAEKDPGSDNVMMLPNWVLAQSEAGRAGENFLCSLFCALIATAVKRAFPACRLCLPGRFVLPADRSFLPHRAGVQSPTVPTYLEHRRSG